MKEEVDFTETNSSFGIITDDKDVEIVTQELGIKPDRFFNKGDLTVSKYSDQIGKKPYGLWVLEKKTITEEIDMSIHIKHFQDILGDKIDIIEKLENHYKFECAFRLLVFTEDVGACFDLTRSEQKLIYNISNSFYCSINTVEKLKRDSDLNF